MQADGVSSRHVKLHELPPAIYVDCPSSGVVQSLLLVVLARAIIALCSWPSWRRGARLRSRRAPERMLPALGESAA